MANRGDASSFFRRRAMALRNTQARRRIRINLTMCSPRLIIGLFVLAICPVSVRAAESLEQTINYLLEDVAKSNATFIRNGQSHTPVEAAAHIKAKYEHFKGEIKTPEDFIRLSASKSLLSGEPYRIRTSDGKEMLLDAWLTEELKKHRQ